MTPTVNVVYFLPGDFLIVIECSTGRGGEDNLAVGGGVRLGTDV
jgi:hypothetical protein